MWHIVFPSFLALLTPEVQTVHGTPESRIEGILEVRGIFGEYPCTRYRPESFEVREGPSPESSVAGRLEVVREWYADGSESCEAIRVGVRAPDDSTVQPVVVREFGYEQPGLVVLETDGEAFRIALEDGSGWIRPTTFEFLSYEALVSDGLTFIAEGWAGELWTAPMESTFPIPDSWQSLLPDELIVEVLEHRTVEGELWFHVRLGPEAGCEFPPPELPVVEGWVPGFTASGTNALWFYSRGC